MSFYRSPLLATAFPIASVSDKVDSAKAQAETKIESAKAVVESKYSAAKDAVKVSVSALFSLYSYVARCAFAL